MQPLRSRNYLRFLITANDNNTDHENYTGKTFSTLIQDIRLSRAAELLKQPTLPVTTVMEEIGYSNITHFYKIFEKRFHMTPAEYRSSISPDSSLL